MIYLFVKRNRAATVDAIRMKRARAYIAYANLEIASGGARCDIADVYGIKYLNRA